MHARLHEIRGHVAVEYEEGRAYVVVQLDEIEELTLDAANARLLAEQLELWCQEIRALASHVDDDKGPPS
jgi:hypothetical protein